MFPSGKNQSDSMPVSDVLIHLPHIALLAIHNLRPVRRPSCRDFFPAFTAFALPKLTRIAQSKTVEMTLVGTASRKRNSLPAIKFQLFRGNFKRFASDFAFNRRIQNIIRNIFYIIRKITSFNNFFNFRRSDFVIVPSETLINGLFFCQRIVHLSRGFVVPMLRNF